MFKAVIFGGTTEGRKLCEFCAKHNLPIRYCVATNDGARPVEALPNINVHVGRLSADEMADLFHVDNPVLIIDATHPYAAEASRNIAAACRRAGHTPVRVARDISDEQGCNYFNNIDELFFWLKEQTGNIFVTTGTNNAEVFTKLPDFQSRVWLRVLPSMDSLRICLNLGYHPDRIICMQGPFSEELNRAFFQAADAKILVTKNSGGVGGFFEKVRAAESLSMMTAVLSKPGETGGVILDEAFKTLMEINR